MPRLEILLPFPRSAGKPSLQVVAALCTGRALLSLLSTSDLGAACALPMRPAEPTAYKVQGEAAWDEKRDVHNLFIPE